MTMLYPHLLERMIRLLYGIMGLRHLSEATGSTLKRKVNWQKNVAFNFCEDCIYVKKNKKKRSFRKGGKRYGQKD